MDDNDVYYSELVNLRNQLCIGVIVHILISVSAGETPLIDGAKLHTMEATFATVKCVPYVCAAESEERNLSIASRHHIICTSSKARIVRTQ